MAGFGLNMNTLVSNINQCGQKDLSLKVRHKAYARPLAVIVAFPAEFNNLTQQIIRITDLKTP
jgi:hypothetical protein